MRIRSTVLVVCVSTLLVDFCFADAPGETLVTNYEPSNAAWTKGDIAIVTKQDGSSIFGLSFSMPRGQLTSLIVRGRHWQRDVTNLVSKLSDPYPLRSQVWIHKMAPDGEVLDGSLLMPFGSEGQPCQQIDIRFVGGNVAEDKVTPASALQCEP